MISTLDGAAEASHERFSRQVFWAGLLIANLAPLALILAPASVGSCLPGTSALILLASAHAGTSTYFYTDPEFRPLVRGNLVPFAIGPVAICAAFVAVWHVLPRAWASVEMAYVVWQLYHYQRQSYGIAAFACRADKVRVPARLSEAFTLTVLAGSLGFCVGRVVTPCLIAAAVLYLGALLWIAMLLVKAPDIRRSPTALGAMVAGGLFLLPTLIPTRDVVVTFWSYAIAHGAQYLIFMAVIAGAAPRRYLALLCFLAAFVLVGLLVQPLTKAFWLPINFGLGCSHFLIDAKVWKMREAPQRELIGRRLRFVLGALRPT